ncbi:TonB-dependent hemoglobin/transferrin/lactoferrin family receptor [Pseudomonas daroniae]|uniref:TonB-dependent hemoglobin/transferrin/lactoferrin family receptor n=1 Tax=Phytopseudomonas daroniae TaxID=2487519 RepID=A0A4Q9QHK6_9GAMM|nr:MULTISPECIES: TonB-dependent receptor [Pseudomonas]TBU74288.1 TonB-dependent hemoglobin/transferrin/lactoferrin family receptor [Pseudomonas daroniae]TBU75934.1 TonB-dependent hemoglobin/transferrin/lactoferrin family receptor [Pseudomonas daroniae]TBU85528.1 TonB-dependent hemoglobin/transferrin/lactoferrin family receptor [Pseudomonas sp. FRB 228]TBU94376.1 TonB-dependent hemoglobin/transferrin/lactoferrin family receptor [Pseudomonas daroniae]
MTIHSRRPLSRRLSTASLSLLALAISCASLPSSAHAADDGQGAQQQNQASGYRFTIARQPLVSALNTFSEVTGWQVGLPAELASGVYSPGLTGQLPAEQALARLLEGTGITYHSVGARSVVLIRTPTQAMALQPLTVTATRRAQSVSEVPSSVSVHSREQLDRQNVNTIKELVRDDPSVSVGGTGQRAGISGYNIRGIDGDRVLTQIDGVEVPASFFNGPYANTHRNYVDPEIVKRVEILHGPASALYGSSAIGGAVSYFTLDPDDIIKPGQDVGARLKTGYSSADDSWLTSATVAGRHGDFDALLHLSQRNGHETESYGSTGGTGLTRTEANPEDVRTTNILAKLGWNYNDSDRLQLTYEKYKDDRDTNQLSAVGGPFNAGSGFGYYHSRQGNDTITRERFGLEHSLALDSLLADNLKWSLNYQIAKTDQSTVENYVPTNFVTGAVTRDVMRYRDTYYKDRQWVLDAQLDKAFAIGDTDHLLTYGANLKHQKVTGLRTGYGICLAAQTSGTINCSAVGAVSTASADTPTPQSDFPAPTIDTYGLFVQDEIRWNQWTFLPGLRYDYTRLEPKLTDEFLATITASNVTEYSDETKTWHRVSPKLGVTYAFDDHYTWFGQYAEGFRTPTAKALYGRFENLAGGYTVEPNSDLDPEKSRGVETGLRGNFEGGSFDVALFYNRYRDFIDENAITANSNALAFQSQNISHASIRGVELKGRLNLDSFGALPGLYTQGSIAYARGRNDDTGEPLNSVNPLTGVFGLGYDQERYGALLNWTLVKRKSRIDDSAFNAPDGTSGQFRTPGFGILDLSGYYKLTDDLTVNAGLYNLTDKQYWLWDDVRGYDGVGEAGVTSPANLDRLTQPGRNFSVNLVWDI